MPKAVLNEDRVIWVPEGHQLAINERAYDPETDGNLPLHHGYDFDALEAASRRSEREKKFSTTLDKMNAAWYNALSDQQKANLDIWRQQWLDYPATDIAPDDSLVNDIFSQSLQV